MLAEILVNALAVGLQEGALWLRSQANGPHTYQPVQTELAPCPHCGALHWYCDDAEVPGHRGGRVCRLCATVWVDEVYV